MSDNPENSNESSDGNNSTNQIKKTDLISDSKLNISDPQENSINRLEINQIESKKVDEPQEIVDLREKLRNAYYEIGKSAESAGDRFTLMKDYDDGIKFYKNALSNYKNGETQLLKEPPDDKIKKVTKKLKDALDPILKFDEGAVTGWASVLNYNLPSSSSFAVRNYMELQVPLDWFHPINALHSMTVDEIKNRVNAVAPQSVPIPPFRDPNALVSQNESSMVNGFTIGNNNVNSSKVFTNKVSAKIFQDAVQLEQGTTIGVSADMQQKYFDEQAKYYTPDKVQELLEKFPAGHEFWKQFPEGHPLYKYNFKKIDELTMKQAEAETLRLRKEIKIAHDQIKEISFSIMQTIETIDKTLHAGEFSKNVTEIAKVIKDYQAHDPYSLVSKEKQFLEGPFKQVGVYVGKVSAFILALIEKLKKELPMDKKIELENRIKEEIDKYNNKITNYDTDKDTQKKNENDEYQSKVGTAKLDYDTKLMNLKAEIETQSAQLKEINLKIQNLEKEITQSDSFVQRVTGVLSLRDRVKSLDEALRTMDQKYLPRLNETYLKYRNQNLPYIPNIYGNYLTPTNYQGFKNVYNTEIQNTVNYINNIKNEIKNIEEWRDRYKQWHWWYYEFNHYNNRLLQLQSELKHQENQLNELQKLLEEVNKKESIRNQIINEMNSERQNLINQREGVAQELKASLNDIYTRYPETANPISNEVTPILTSKYNEAKASITRLDVEKKTLTEEAKVVKKDLSKQFEPIYMAHFETLKTLKQEFENALKKIEEEFAKLKVQAKKEHDATIQTIRDFYLQFLPDDIEKIIVGINTHNNNIVANIEQINTLSTVILENIEKIYDLAQPYNYQVLITKMQSRKNSKEFAEDLKNNYPQRIKKSRHKRVLEKTYTPEKDILNLGDSEKPQKGGIKESVEPEFECDIELRPLKYDIIEAQEYINDKIVDKMVDKPIESLNVAFTGVPSLLNSKNMFVLDVQYGEIPVSLDALRGEVERLIDSSISPEFQVSYTGLPPNLRKFQDFPVNKVNAASNLLNPSSVTIRTQKVDNVFVVTYYPDGKEIRNWPSNEDIEVWGQSGYAPKVVQTLDGEYEVKFVKAQKEIDPKVFLVFEYTISSFLADYGAGKTIKTFSLLPGESTTITIKTWKSTKESREKCSSILESNNKSSADAMEKILANESERGSEQTKINENYTKNTIMPSISIGPVSFGGVGTENGSKSGFAQSQKEVSRCLNQSVNKHADTQSSKRESSVSETTTAEVEKGEEQSIVRELKNINLSKCLNFVFKELNQEYITLIHLSNIKIAFGTGFPADYIEIPLHEMNGFAETYFREGYDLDDNEEITTGLRVPVREKIKRFITSNLNYIYDYKSRPYVVVEEIMVPGTDPPIPSGMYRFKCQPFRQYCEEIVRQHENDPVWEDRFQDVLKGHIDHGVDGIVVAISRQVMKTDAVFIEAVLGKGIALDDYAIGSQVEAIREKQLENAKVQLALDIVNQVNMTPEEAKFKADLYYKLFGLTPLKNPFEKSIVGVFPEVKDSLDNVKI